jgi:ankyrin repeat protein
MNQETAELMEAAAKGELARVRWLLGAGAKVNERAGTGDGALAYAAFEHQPEVIEALIDGGADVNGVNPNDGSTSLSRAMLFALIRPGRARRTIEVLLERGARVDLRPYDALGPIEHAAKLRGLLEQRPDWPKSSLDPGRRLDAEIFDRPLAELRTDLYALAEMILRQAGVRLPE